MGEGTTAKRPEDDGERRRSTRERLDKSTALRVGLAGLADGIVEARPVVAQDL